MRTIGLFLGTTEDSYGRELVRGAHAAAAARDARLVCLTSGSIDSRRDFEAQQNVLYELVDPRGWEGDPGRPPTRRFDGLVLAGSLSHNLSTDELAAFCRRFAPTPLITLAIELPGFPAVVTDNRAGFQALMDHLVKDHGYTRFAWLGGPPGQQESDLRHQIYRERLEAAGIAVVPEWEVSGDFTQSSGYWAAQELLARHGASALERWQVVVSANDDMAIGAVRAFGELGWVLPDDCAVTGFDNLPAGQVLEPALTTVHQSAEEQAARAVARLLDSLDARMTEAEPLTPHLVIRTSCGCAPEALDTATADDLRHHVASLQNRLRAESRERSVTDGWLDRLRGASEALLSGTSFEEFLEFLRDSLTSMRFKGVWLALFDDPTRPTGPSRLHLMVSRDGPSILSPGGISFPSGDFIPGSWDSLNAGSSLVVVEALFSRNYRLGFLVFDAEVTATRVTGILRTLISGALHAVLHLEERRRAEQKLIQSEKLAALGALVAGVAHEINTPLGVAITASSFLAHHSSLFVQALREGRRTWDDVEDFIGDVAQAGTAIETNLTRAAALVTSFKQVSADQTSEERRVFAVKEYLEAALVSLRFQWKSRPIQVSLEGPDELMIDSYPGALVQIVTNLLMNSLMHAFPDGRSGSISLRLSEAGPWAVLMVSDDGAGVAPADQAKIFEPFFTTKRGHGGTGLGLSIVYNLVTSLMGGEIAFTSAPDRGTTFEIRLARQAPTTGTDRQGGDQRRQT